MTDTNLYHCNSYYPYAECCESLLSGDGRYHLKSATKVIHGAGLIGCTTSILSPCFSRPSTYVPEDIERATATVECLYGGGFIPIENHEKPEEKAP